MKQFVIVGATGSGKTTAVKNIIRSIDLPKFIYDVNNEYSEFQKMPFLNMEQFIEQAMKKTKTVIVFEEASIFFGHSSASREIREILVRKRHTGNIIFFCFHALRQIPAYVLDFSDFLIIKKTVLDSTERYKDREEIIKAYNKVKQSANFYETFTLNLRPKIR